MAQTFPEGIRIFAPNDKAPAWVKGQLVIDTAKAIEWLQQQGQTVRLDLKEGNKGLYLAVNDYKPQGKTKTFDEPLSDLPF